MYFIFLVLLFNEKDLLKSIILKYRVIIFYLFILHSYSYLLSSIIMKKMSIPNFKFLNLS